MVNWDAIGAVGEILGAIAVVATLGYLAVQVRAARDSAADANRLNRANGVTQMALEFVGNSDLANSVMKSHKTEDYYTHFASTLDISFDDASRSDWFHVYYFWLHWGQYSSSKTEEDLAELSNVIRAFYGIPAVRYSWDHSPFSKPVLDPAFVNYVNQILSGAQDQ
ncbi:MAG: hypothetical protein AB8B81_14365 [Halioglobus sp.]